MSMLERIRVIDDQLEKLGDRCAIASGNPEYKSLHRQRVELLEERFRMAGLSAEQFILLRGYEAWDAIAGPYRIGDRVSVTNEINRRGRIVGRHVNVSGHVSYILADGGMFSASEIEFDKLASKGGRNVA